MIKLPKDSFLPTGAFKDSAVNEILKSMTCQVKAALNGTRMRIGDKLVITYSLSYDACECKRPLDSMLNGICSLCGKGISNHEKDSVSVADEYIEVQARQG